ncbi:M48 family metallopeptidase [Patescibacteria group bacterium]|nr:M48 family metallopeptidase [Patescibacteria group bacterium]
MLIFTILVGLLGYIFSIALEQGIGFFLGAVGFASSMSFFSFYFSDRVILAISGAKPIKKSDNPRLFRTVENLCLGVGLPYPEIYIINDTAPNAFATGRDPRRAKVAVTTGLLSKLDDQELEGVIAHELSHIKNYDIRLMSIVVILVGIVALLSGWFRGGGFRISRGRDRDNGNGIIILIALIASLLAPIIAQLLKLALSRQREYLADSSAALLTRYPEGLASALIKISADREPLEVANTATAHLYIVNPLKNYSGNVEQMFSTHPPVEERIRRLRQM